MLEIEVVFENHTTVAQVGAQMKQVLLRLADQLDPERHHLHVAARASA